MYAATDLVPHHTTAHNIGPEFIFTFIDWYIGWLVD
jgi:hypothetical protein